LGTDHFGRASFRFHDLTSCCNDGSILVQAKQSPPPPKLMAPADHQWPSHCRDLRLLARRLPSDPPRPKSKSAGSQQPTRRAPSKTAWRVNCQPATHRDTIPTHRFRPAPQFSAGTRQTAAGCMHPVADDEQSKVHDWFGVPRTRELWIAASAL